VQEHGNVKIAANAAARWQEKTELFSRKLTFPMRVQTGDSCKVKAWDLTFTANTVSVTVAVSCAVTPI
jgi:hypothetical protein